MLLSWFPWYLVAANKVATDPRVPSGNIEVITHFTVVVITWLTITVYLYHKWPQKCSVCRNHNSVLSSFMTYHRVYSTTSAVCGAGTSYPKVVPVFTHGIRGVSVERTLVFCTIFCRSLFVLSHLDIELIVVRFTDSGYHFGIFKLFLNLVCPFMDFYTSNACHY